MVRGPMRELGRASSAQRFAAAGAWALISRKTKWGSCGEAVGGGHMGTDDAYDNITWPREGPLPCPCVPLEVRAGECRQG